MTSATATTLSAMPHNGNEVCVYLHQTKDHNDKTHTLMVPRSATVVDLHKAVRSTLRLCSLTPLALAVGENTLSATVTMEDLLTQCAQDNEELHVTYSVEKGMGLWPCFGCGPIFDSNPLQ
uniref:Serine protease pic autotransporter n=1 Tax=Lygus hesperus TaxID=30085 RepID=A0A0A9XYK1_LYGHE